MSADIFPDMFPEMTTDMFPDMVLDSSDICYIGACFRNKPDNAFSAADHGRDAVNSQSAAKGRCAAAVVRCRRLHGPPSRKPAPVTPCGGGGPKVRPLVQ